MFEILERLVKYGEHTKQVNNSEYNKIIKKNVKTLKNKMYG